MGPRLLLIVALSVLLAGAPFAPAGGETRAASLVVRVNVIRSCSIDSSGRGGSGVAVIVTCSRSGSEPGVVSTTSGAAAVTRVVPVPARQTTVVATRTPLRAVPGATSPAPGPATPGVTTLQLVILNF